MKRGKEEKKRIIHMAGRIFRFDWMYTRSFRRGWDMAVHQRGKQTFPGTAWSIVG